LAALQPLAAAVTLLERSGPIVGAAGSLTTRRPKRKVPNIMTNMYLRLRELMVRAKEGEDGQGMVEYALILVLIAVVVIVILAVVGNQVKNTFSNVSNGLGQ